MQRIEYKYTKASHDLSKETITKMLLLIFSGRKDMQITQYTCVRYLILWHDKLMRFCINQVVMGASPATDIIRYVLFANRSK